MPLTPFQTSPDGTLLVAQSGTELLTNPLLNKGTAFTEDERRSFGLNGLLPPQIASLEEQLSRRYTAYRALGDDLSKYIFLREMQDTNETLFYALLATHLEEMLPVIYTPTVGQGCELFSRIYRRPRGLFLSVPLADQLPQIIAHPRYDAVEVIVVTDGERILGLGDQGAGGMGIPIGKLSLYTACGGIHPATTLPILLDVGTDNEERRNDPLYIGWHHPRVRGAEYDAFIEEFIAAVTKRWPNVLLQFEDFARANASRLLERYRDRLCSFNDDIQGTAAVATGALLSAIAVTGMPLSQQRVCIVGAGTAGCGIASLIHAAMREEGLSQEAASQRFFLVDCDGLLVDGMEGLLPFQRPFVRGRKDVAGWRLGEGGNWPWSKSWRPGRTITLQDVVANAKPTVLIGVTGQRGLFSEPIVRAMAKHVERPIIFPLSNPTSRSEAAPEDLYRWTEGRALVGVGSPFPPVMRKGRPFKTDQTNNSYIFPGVGLGVLACGARRISDGMFLAAARTLAANSPARNDPEANLLPPVASLRFVAEKVAFAVARQAATEGLAPEIEPAALIGRIHARMWTPRYAAYRAG
ncbi:MAG: NAD-dependent malic enzyme [Alphaproteobacteria bacterium]|nr:NAD-dependent malic enzyme [Alphaproteobacteria bacterium]